MVRDAGVTPIASYEEFRQQRIKANNERLLNLGILHLKSLLSPPPKTTPNPSELPKSLPLPHSARRSSRLKTANPVNYSNFFNRPKKESSKDLEIRIKEGSKPEIYDESHKKLLGDCKSAWTLSMDEEYREDGKHIYDPEKGDKCHECRQETLEMSNSPPITKSSPNVTLPESLALSTSARRSSRLRTMNPVNYSSFYTIYHPEKRETCHQCRETLIGLHTHCSTCKAGQGHFCGSCLFKRYGENVIEVKENASWICPVCRGICNCNRCRKAKGWEPTGHISKKVTRLCFKSVAHYLIHTKQVKTQPEDIGVEISESEESCMEKEEEDEIASMKLLN
ncbi:Zinc-finger domain of monoamine-oxidase A repressor R1 [Euphorbia peplus]|nr:Zinc-finger domain of monoamine-oxidase A repressor R1 [Euphorbia peplus]